MSALAFPTRSATLSSAADAILKSSTPAKLDWKKVDIETFPAEYAALYANLREAVALLKAHRTAFEDAICGPLAKMLNAKPGQDVVFTYNYGLAVALADKREPKSKANALRF